MATLSNLQQRLRWRFGSRSDLASGDGLALLNSWINRAVQTIAHSYPFHQQEVTRSVNTVVATDFIATPIDLFAVTSVYNVTSSVALTMFSGGWEERERQLVNSNGRPVRWIHYGDNIHFDRPVDAIYTLRVSGRQEPIDLAAPTDPPPFPKVWHDGVEILAGHYGWMGLNDEERATAVLAGEWQAFLRSVKVPKAIEAYNRKTRGVRTAQSIRSRTLGV